MPITISVRRRTGLAGAGASATGSATAASATGGSVTGGSAAGWCSSMVGAGLRRHVGFLPALAGIEHGDRRGFLGGVRTEVVPVDVARLADDEGHDAGLAVLHRPGDHGEAADHAILDQVVVGA